MSAACGKCQANQHNKCARIVSGTTAFGDVFSDLLAAIRGDSESGPCGCFDSSPDLHKTLFRSLLRSEVAS